MWGGSLKKCSLSPSIQLSAIQLSAIYWVHHGGIPGYVLWKQLLKWNWSTRCLLGTNIYEKKQVEAELEQGRSQIARQGWQNLGPFVTELWTQNCPSALSQIGFSLCPPTSLPLVACVHDAGFQKRAWSQLRQSLSTTEDNLDRANSWRVTALPAAGQQLFPWSAIWMAHPCIYHWVPDPG